MLKNNDTHLTGITIRAEESHIAPTIYLEDKFGRFMEGTSVPVIVSEIISIYESHKADMPFDVTNVTDFLACKDMVCYRLVGADRNRELLEDAPHLIACGDIAVAFFILVSNDGDCTGSITVRNQIFSMWDVTVEELFDIALVNTQRLFRGSVMSMASVMTELLGDRMDEEDSDMFFDMVVSDDDMPMYVCTNESKINGAGVLLYDGLLKEFASRIGDDFYILPSSRHEVILVPASMGMDVDYLRDMVHQVNSAEVAPEDVLSDSVYIYRRDLDAISIA